jgi:hypothetical protein
VAVARKRAMAVFVAGLAAAVFVSALAVRAGNVQSARTPIVETTSTDRSQSLTAATINQLPLSRDAKALVDLLPKGLPATDAETYAVTLRPLGANQTSSTVIVRAPGDTPGPDDSYTLFEPSATALDAAGLNLGDPPSPFSTTYLLGRSAIAVDGKADSGAAVPPSLLDDNAVAASFRNQLRVFPELTIPITATYQSVFVEPAKIDGGASSPASTNGVYTESVFDTSAAALEHRHRLGKAAVSAGSPVTLSTGFPNPWVVSGGIPFGGRSLSPSGSTTPIPTNRSAFGAAAAVTAAAVNTNVDLGSACASGAPQCTPSAFCGVGCVNLDVMCAANPAMCGVGPSVHIDLTIQIMMSGEPAGETRLGRVNLSGQDRASLDEGRPELAAFVLPRSRPRSSPWTLDEDIVAAAQSQSTGGTGGALVAMVANGASTGQSFALQILDRTGRIKNVALPEGVVLQPVKLSDARAPAPAAAQPSIPFGAYCLEPGKPPPLAGMVYRIADQALQQRFRPLRYVLQAGRRLGAAGALHPDSSPNGYIDAIKQYAVWTKLENWDVKKFGDEFLSRTRKNVEALKRPWTSQMEAGVRAAIPNRWQDITQVITEGSALEQRAAARFKRLTAQR